MEDEEKEMKEREKEIEMKEKLMEDEEKEMKKEKGRQLVLLMGFVSRIWKGPIPKLQLQPTLLLLTSSRSEEIFQKQIQIQPRRSNLVRSVANGLAHL